MMLSLLTIEFLESPLLIQFNELVLWVVVACFITVVLEDRMAGIKDFLADSCFFPSSMVLELVVSFILDQMVFSLPYPETVPLPIRPFMLLLRRLVGHTTLLLNLLL